jgi:branched-chain amino acid transport system substrate-binding protein
MKKKVKQKWLWAILGIIIILVFLIALIISPVGKRPDEIRIGVIIPLTGKVGIFGQWIKKGIDLGLEDIEKNNPKLKGRIRIIYEDSQNDAKSGIAALGKLVASDKVEVVISAMSKVTIPLIPIVEREGIPLLMQDVTYPRITDRGRMLFRHFIQSDREAQLIAEHAISLGIRKMGILFVNDEAGLGAKESFIHTFKKFGGEIVGVEAYEATDTDMKTQISKIDSSGVDAIFLFGNGPSWAVCLRQIKELGFKGTIFTNTAMYIPNFRDMAGKESTEGVYFTYPYMDTASSFVQRYRQKFGEDPPIESAYAWDLIHIIAKALQSEGKTMYEKLLSVKDLDGAFGHVQIPEDKDIHTKVGIGVIKDGKVATIRIEK